MNANAYVVDPLKGDASIEWPKFSAGLILRDTDLQAATDYTRDLSRLMFRSLFGCGVVCGLVVQQKVDCDKLIVTIGAGVALTCQGDPVHVPKPVQVKLDPSCGRKIPDKLWVTLCLSQKCCAPRSVACACDEDDAGSVCTRVLAGYEIRISGEAPTDCVCRCPEPVRVPGSRRARGTGDAAAQRNQNAAAAQAAPSVGERQDCWCADPKSDCYKEHYAGDCGCDCCCDGSCVVLAVLTATHAKGAADGDLGKWTASHSVRRVVRPVLMRDPQAWLETHPPNPGA